MGLTKAQLEALNQSSFPDNQEELITPEVLRTYNAASIDNTVNQDTYTTDSASFDSRINGFVAGTGFLSTASFNAYTASTNSEISAIESFTASVSTSVGLLQTFSGSQYKIDSASFSSRINTAGNTGLVTTASFNAYTSSNDTKVNNLTAATASYALSASVASVDIAQDGKIASLTSATSSYAISSSVKVVTDSLQTQINGLATTSSVNTLSQSVDSRLDTLETAGYVTATITGSSLVTASIAGQTLTFTKGDSTTFNVTLPSGSGPVDTSGLVTTSSFNAYTASVNSELTAIETFTASISTSVGLLQTFSSSQYNLDSASFDSRLDAEEFKSTTFVTTASFNAYTSSQDFKNTTFATTSSLSDLSASIYSTDATQSSLINGKLDTSSFNTFSSSYVNESASFSSRIEAIDDDNVTTASFNQYTQSTDNRLNSIESFTASVSTSVGLLQTFSSSQYKGDSSSFDSRIDSLEAFSQSADNRYVQNSQTSSMAVSSSLYSVTSSYAVFAQTASEARNLVIIARNGNQSTLNAGTVVRITSAVGDNPIFNTASYDTEALSSNTLGILGSSILSGADGEVVVNGIVLGVNTDPTLGYVAGDIIYLSSSGQFTRVQPQAPLQTVTLGEVLRAQQNNGSIYVNVSNGWELNELHNVQINTPLTNDLLAYESSSYGLWKNKTYSELGLNTTSSFNDYTQSTNTFTASISTSVGLLQTFSGSEYKADSASFTSRINGIPTINTGSFATTGSNTFIGNQTINGAVQISSSATYDLDITGAFQATAASRISGSNGTVTLAQNAVTVASGSGTNLINTLAARGYISFNSGSSNQIAIYSGILPIGGFTSAKAGGGIAVSIGSPGVYYYPIEFQATTAYTDGRVIFNTPISASAGITASNAFINGELYSVTSASFDSRINAGGSIYTGSFAITGSNTFIGDQNINGNITASKLLVTDSGTTAIEYQLQSTGSVMGVYNTSYGKDNIKVYQYQGQPYAFNVNLTANQANAYTGSQFEWGLQLNGSNVSLPGGGGTYFAMVSGSTTGSNGDPGADKKGLNFLGTAMVLDMYADTSFRRGVFVDKGMFVSQSQGGSQRPALTVDGTSAASNRAITATGSVDITGSLTLNGHQLFSPAYGSFTGSAVSSGVLTTYNQEFASGVEIVSSSFARVLQNGIYQVTANAQFDADAASGNSEVFLKKNGTTIVATTMSGYTSSGGALNGVSTTALVQLNAFEYVEVGINLDDDSLVSGRLSIVRIA